MKIERSRPRKSVTVTSRSSRVPGGSSDSPPVPGRSMTVRPSRIRVARRRPSSGGLNQRERRNNEARSRNSGSTLPMMRPSRLSRASRGPTKGQNIHLLQRLALASGSSNWLMSASASHISVSGERLRSWARARPSATPFMAPADAPEITSTMTRKSSCWPAASRKR